MSDVSWGQVIRQISWGRRAVLVFCVFAAVTTSVLSGWAIGKIVSAMLKASAAEAEAKALATEHHEPVNEGKAFDYPFEMRDVSMPLTDRRKARSAFAQFTIVFDCPTAESVAQMPAHRAKILDAILEAGTHMTTNDFGNRAGFDTFKMHLKVLLENRLGKIAPRDVVINSWAMN